MPSKKIESVWYNVALGLTGAIKGFSRAKLYQQLQLQHLYETRRTRRCLFLELFSSGQPNFNYFVLLSMGSSCWNVSSLNTGFFRSEYLKNSFIPNVIDEMKKLSYNLFCITWLIFISSFLQYDDFQNNSVGKKLFKKLLLNLSLSQQNWNCNTLFSAFYFMGSKEVFRY